MNFCPKCGSKRGSGRFCGGCGYQFEGTASPSISATAALIPAGWYEDPAKSGQERYWTGREWTEEIRPAGSVKKAQIRLKSTLVYGKGFDTESHCSNCGEPRGRRSTTCLLCGEEL